MHPLIKDLKTFILDTLFPIKCVCCGEEGPFFVCELCLLQFSEVPNQRCLECDRPALHGLTHPGCQKRISAERMISAWNYHNPKVSQAILAGKYHFLPNVYEELTDFLTETIQQTANLETLKSFVLCPLPLTNQRRRWRGFNQAEIICQRLGENFSLPVEFLLQRTKNRPPQKDLPKEERLKNIKDCFACIDEEKTRSRDILLIDDVTTTGATLREAAKVLKRAGAKQVWCLTLAQD